MPCCLSTLVLIKPTAYSYTHSTIRNRGSYRAGLRLDCLNHEIPA
jgi:hypothetical protein